MTQRSGDRWAAGDAYEAYMGRWSRALARVFLGWFRPPPAGHWLEVGCGTGALTAAIRELGRPASVVACDPSESFIAYARDQHTGDESTDDQVPPGGRAGSCAFEIIAAPNAFPERPGGFDTVVSGLVLNFIPDPGQALAVMRRRCRPGGTVAAYIWDYAGGLDFLSHFWDEAVAADPGAAALDESVRFGSWRPAALAELFRAAGLGQVETDVLELPTEFASFGDFWRPFLGGSGPAPTYVASLTPMDRDRLKAGLQRRLPADDHGRIRLRARALVIRGTADD